METHYILETKRLSHSFADGARVLNELDLQVPAGSIYGFLGANGAGKTTTIRLVLGLLKKQKGEILLFGRSLGRGRLEALRRIGAMIESPSLYGHLTAAENLQVLQKVYQCPKERIPLVLEMTGLSGTKDKKAARFSLGMKQRLSIAMALLHEPELLILDEPTNGLDPNGMIEVRELLLSLNREHGTSIMISSHLLAEIGKLVSHVGIIHQGQLLFQGELGELHKQRDAGKQLIIKTNNTQKTIAVLIESGISFNTDGQAVHISMPAPSRIAEIVEKLVGEGIGLYELSPVQNDLETIFMDMITN